jgi:hypothetical protein
MEINSRLIRENVREDGKMADAEHFYDVLIVGAGNAACCAAHAAIEGKARVGILEKASRTNRGGNSALTGHMRFVFNGIEDVRPLVRNITDEELHAVLERLPHRTEAEHWDEVMQVTNNQSDQDMLQVHVSESLNTVQWLAGKGTRLGAGGRLQDAVRQRPHDERRRLRAAAAQFRDPGTRGSGVSLRDCRDGARAGRDGPRDRRTRFDAVGLRDFLRKAIVLACGSFESNPEMRARYLGPGWDMVRPARRAVQHRRRPAHGDAHRGHAARELEHLPRFPAGHQPAPFQDPRRLLDHRLLRTLHVSVLDHGQRARRALRGRRPPTCAAGLMPRWGGRYWPSRAASRSRFSTPRRASSTSIPTNYDKATTAKAPRWKSSQEELDINVENFIKTVREFNAAIQPGTLQSGPAQAGRKVHGRHLSAQEQLLDERRGAAVRRRFRCAAA